MHESTGSSDWMPPWAMGRRLEDIQPSFDVYCLGKIFWAMVAGKKTVTLWFHRDKGHRLDEFMPQTADLHWAQRILDATVVRDESACLRTAGDLLTLIDQAIRALRVGGQFPHVRGGMLCAFCGFGHYAPSMDGPNKGTGSSELKHFVCNTCGHMVSFRWPRARRFRRGEQTDAAGDRRR